MRKSVLPFVVCLLGVLFALNAGCSPEGKKASHLSDADRYFAAGQYDQAEIEYLNVLKLDAQNARAIGQLGAIYFEQGRFGRAYPLVVRTRELEPDNLANRVRAGRILLMGGDYNQARQEANFVLDRDPQNAEAPILLAETVRKPDELSSIRQRLTQLPAPASERTPVLIALGTLEFRQEHIAEAEALFKRAQAADPKSSAAWGAVGMFYRARRDLPQAEAASKKAAELAPPRSPLLMLYPQLRAQAGDIAGARQFLETVIKQTPDYQPPLILLAEIAATEKKYDEGLTHVGKVLSRDPVNPEALLLSSRLRLAKGEIDQAVTELEKMASLYPKSPQVYYQLGLAGLARKDATNAVSNFSRAVSLSPDFAEATLALGEIYLRRGDFISAIAALKPIVQRRPEILQAHLLLAEAYRGRGDLDSAAATYGRVEQLFPKVPQAYLLKGTVLAQQNKRAEAREAFNQALALAPESLTTVEQLVDLDLAEKNPDAAMQRVSALIAQNPKSTPLYLLQSKIYAVQQDVPRAEAALHKAIELQPDSPAAYLLLARLYVNAKQTEKALQNFQTVVAKDPKHVESWMLIGLIHEQQKNYAGARDAYERLLAANSNFPTALNNLACLYSDQFNQQDRAAELALKARELMPNEPHIADSLGWILYKQRQYPRALALLRESAARLPESATVQFHLGMASYAMGEDASARQLLQRALQIDPALAEASEAQRALAVLALDGTGSTDRARLEKLAAESPDDPAVLVRLSAAYERTGDFDRALPPAEAAQKASPSNVAVLMQLVRIHVARKDTTKAFALAKEARKLAPDDSDLAYTLGRLAFQAGDYRWANGLLQEAALKQPDNADVLYDYAEAAYRAGQIAEAESSARRAAETGALFLRAENARLLAELCRVANAPATAAAAAARIDQALRTDPEYLPALFASGLVHEQKSKPDEARRTYQKILSRYPDFAPAQKRLAALNNPKSG